MCRPVESKLSIVTTAATPRTKSRVNLSKLSSTWNERRRSIISLAWPISPFVLVVLVAWIMPISSCYLNRGYTVWFHWNALYFLLTQSEFIANFCALQGLTVTIGWYSSLLYDWYQYGPFGRILYWNMPQSMTQYYMVMDDQDNNMTATLIYTRQAILVMCLAHVLDIIGHPLLAYYFWRRSWKKHQEKNKNQTTNHHLSAATNSSSNKKISHQNDNNKNQFPPQSNNMLTYLNNMLPWSVIFSSYFLSRFWSVLHAAYNNNEFNLFYFGRDVYVILDHKASLHNIFVPSYAMEGLTYLFMILYKLYFNRYYCTNGRNNNIVNNNNIEKVSPDARRPKTLSTMPSLLRASTVSDDSDED